MWRNCQVKLLNKSKAISWHSLCSTKTSTHMNTTHSKQAYPDLFSRPSAHRFGNTWDTVAVARIVRDNSEERKSPAFLYLGRFEAELLRSHLGAAFGEESVTTLHEIYYMGLKVVTVDADQYINTGGSKEVRTIQTPAFRYAS